METLEIWKDIVWYEGLYKISDNWSVYSIWTPQHPGTQWRMNTWIKSKMLRIHINKYWYYQVQLTKIWKRVTVTVHRLVAQAFIPNAEKKPQVNHINGIKTDNRVKNLEWCTNSENQLHASKMWLKHPLSWEKHPKPMLWKTWILSHRSKKIWMYDIFWNLKEVFYWWREARKKTWISQWNINECCRGRRKLAGGFIWKFI